MIKWITSRLLLLCLVQNLANAYICNELECSTQDEDEYIDNEIIDKDYTNDFSLYVNSGTFLKNFTNNYFTYFENSTLNNLTNNDEIGGYNTIVEGNFTNNGTLFFDKVTDDDYFIFGQANNTATLVVNNISTQKRPALIFGNNLEFNSVVNNKLHEALENEELVQIRSNIEGDKIIFNKEVVNNSDIFGDELVFNAKLTNESTGIIYGNKITFNEVYNDGLISGDNIVFKADVFNNNYLSWIVLNEAKFYSIVNNEIGADLIGMRLKLLNTLNNKGTVDVLDSEFSAVNNFGTIWSYNSLFKDNIQNEGTMSLDDSVVTNNFINSTDNSSLFMANESYIATNNIKNGNYILDNSVIKANNINAYTLDITNSKIVANMVLDELSAYDSIFIVPLGNTIKVDGYVIGENNYISLHNVESAKLKNEYFPIMFANSYFEIEKNFFTFNTKKGFSYYGIDSKYVSFRNYGTYYLIGIGNDSFIKDEDLESLYLGTTSDEKLTALLATLNNEQKDLSLTVDENDIFKYIRSDELMLKNAKFGFKSIDILQNELLASLNRFDIKNKSGFSYKKNYSSFKSKNFTSFKSDLFVLNKHNEHQNYNNDVGLFFEKSTFASMEISNLKANSFGFFYLLSKNNFELDFIYRYTDINFDFKLNDEYSFKNDYFSTITSMELAYLYEDNYYLRPSIKFSHIYLSDIEISKDILNMELKNNNSFNANFGFEIGKNIYNFKYAAKLDYQYRLNNKSSYILKDLLYKERFYISNNNHLNLGFLASYESKKVLFNFSLNKRLFNDSLNSFNANFGLKINF